MDNILVIDINGHELEFEKEFVETYEYTVCDSFARAAEVYLLTDFCEDTLDEIFAKHTEQEIKKMIIEAAKEEIALYKGEL